MSSTHNQMTLADCASFGKLLTDQSDLDATAPSPISSTGEVQCSHDPRGRSLDSPRRKCIIFPNDTRLPQRIKTQGSPLLLQALNCLLQSL